MFKISSHIYKAIENSGISLEELTESEKITIINDIKGKYVDKEKRGNFIWEKLSRYNCISDKEGWKYIKDFIGENKCIIFFNHEDDKKMFIISSGDDLNYILSETCGYEFYITNFICSYLICYNHHDVLIGCGQAEKWIEKLVK